MLPTAIRDCSGAGSWEESMLRMKTDGGPERGHSRTIEG